MTEADLRKYHRVAGVVLAAFVVLQAATGLFFTFEDLEFIRSPGPEDSLIEDVLAAMHHGLGFAGAVYRLVTGLGLLLLALTGLLIWLRIRARTAGPPRLRPVARTDRPDRPSGRQLH